MDIKKYTDCPECSGRGTYFIRVKESNCFSRCEKRVCRHCNGTGRVERGMNNDKD